MNYKKGIHIPPASKVKQPETRKKPRNGSFSSEGWIGNVWDFCKEDSNRVIFSLKAGLAVLLVSLLILIQAPYEVFRDNIIWSIITVAIMFEYTVGATFNRGFNRALGSILAGIFAVSVAQVALCTGHVAEPIIIGAGIFVIGALTSFMKLWPSLVPYEYGFRVTLFTFCLIIVSGYRMGNPVKTAMDRLYSIAIGGFVAVVVNVLIFPIWAGEQLHKELVKSFDSVADSLDECVGKYFEEDGSDHLEFSKTVMDKFPDEPAYRRCQATLNSSAKLDSLANSAKWEPPHGRFRHFYYPWSEYVKVGAVLRYCGYEVMALHGVLHSEIQFLLCPLQEAEMATKLYLSDVSDVGELLIDQKAPYNLRTTFQREIFEVSSQAAELVRSLGKDISNMKFSIQTSLLKRVHISTECLQRAIEMHSYLFTSIYNPPDNSSQPLPKLSHALSSNPYDLSDHLSELGEDDLEQPPDPLQQNSLSGALPPQQAESYHEIMRKQQRRLHSWPSREVDDYKEEGGLGVDLLPRMSALDSTAALSLVTFTSLLIEFVARLDHLIEVVEELSMMAKFKHDGI
ncbi:hypothetical protein HHK36_000127 [Tetracentron sinense]|uniref:Uncharacterized protein n=1 Tax=Tetracentron sinense TaxID=13715 RepID=A0A834ZQJ3_TETSI|nr:hypothetical protein HHK36_000127 [Tetracentron sinense]